MIYFDTSVLAAYDTPEERSVEAAALVAKATYPVVSDLAVTELNVVIVRKEKLGFLPQEGAEAGPILAKRRARLLPAPEGAGIPG